MYDGDEEFEFERDRQAIAALLMARDHPHAAGIVAVSEFRSSYTGGFTDDGGFVATLSVPPELYDRALTEFREPITAACVAVVARQPFLGVEFHVRRPRYDAHWVEAIISVLEPRWVPSERVPTAEVTE
ncbi:hypothetical protein JF735_24055 [Mycobacterium avium]|uniref:hypothetical protein n=1 Tax=Mycobacterium avium TaxID=1764 RepID=UPI001CDADAA1|nr:hypothetical protein [Mycobacterium avium]MCA2296675.1 hypothetical protein [Mycobacterium avium]